MSDNKVIIIDENEEELSPEELEELQRNERLQKLMKKNKPTSLFHSPMPAILLRVLALLGIAGIFIAMLIESGTLVAISLAVSAVSAGASYIFFK